MMDVGDLNELPSRNPVKEEEESVNNDKIVRSKTDEEDRDKGTDADDDDESDDGDIKNNEVEDEDEEEDETESEAPTTPGEKPAPKIVEPPLRQESQPDTESDNDTERDSEGESESDLTDAVKEKSDLEIESVAKRHLMNESSPPSDSETDVSSRMHLFLVK